ncbi:hypothetical protein JOM56_011536 [Amanita muscaria]
MATVDVLLSRLRELNLSRAILSEHSKGRMLDAPFSMSMSIHCPADVSDPAIIDIFTPKFPKSDPLRAPSCYQDPSFDVFVAMRSRVVRFYDLPPMAESYLSVMFLSRNPPISMWVMQDAGPCVREVWAVFQTHEEARAALALCSPTVSVAPALESDLEPYHKLQPFALKPISRHFSHVAESQVPAPSNLHQPPTLPNSTSQTISIDANPRPHLSPSPSFPDLQSAAHLMHDKFASQKHDYPISTNPPNPRSNFRIGDWICTSAKCGAHNFGRNLVCIGCGSSRVNNGSLMLQHPSATARAIPSPRFATQNNTRSQTATALQGCTYLTSCPTPFVNEPTVNLSKPHQPLLTPSGRGFAIGGRVRNISSDPLTPCIMYWPDNEPLPEQGQIRPNALVTVTHPPILNTGNRGPISHQPGDWVCQKCNYLNWRRRKVCQTCLPYAEGNGDSISAAIQAERISLLTSVLAQTQLSGNNATLGPAAPQGLRSHSATPPHPRCPPMSPGLLNSVHRSQSHAELASRYIIQDAKPQPIYQTSGHRRPSPLYMTPRPDMMQGQPTQTPPSLLPSFLQDIVQSPTLSSLSSASSPDLSFEDEKTLTQNDCSLPAKQDSASSSPSANIWRLDFEESRSLNAFMLPTTQHDLIGARKTIPPMFHISQPV